MKTQIRVSYEARTDWKAKLTESLFGNYDKVKLSKPALELVEAFEKYVREEGKEINNTAGRSSIIGKLEITIKIPTEK
jgi:hypothetical protein